jgi:ubiquinone/menaquinone biosynthesis C-methylase UbiE
MTLSRSKAERFYDRFGRKQDAQAFYEDAALEELIAHATFESAQNVYEFGCGTGRLAERLLKQTLPSSAVYTAADISRVMISIAQQRLKPYGKRIDLIKSNGAIHVRLTDHTVDRFVSTYVLDLLADADIRNVIAEAYRVLRTDGKLCLVSLTSGVTMVSKLVSTLWEILFRVYPTLVGGCRPIPLESYLDQKSWSVEYHHIVVQYGVPSEVVIASPKNMPTISSTRTTKSIAG